MTGANIIMHVLFCIIATSLAADTNGKKKEQWAAEIRGGESVAKRVAQNLGLKYIGKIPHLKEKYIFELESHARVRREAKDVERELTLRFQSTSEVSWVSKATELKRKKRDYLNLADKKSPEAHVRVKRPAKKTKTQASRTFLNNKAQSLHRQSSKSFNRDDVITMFSDPLWSKQWYLHDAVPPIAQLQLDLNVLPTWRNNYTGRGVTVAVVDDGLEWAHPDIVDNYDPDSSYDFNNDREDPTPNTSDDFNNHGTRCAGEIAMIANNSYCGVGIAYNAKIGGIKILDGYMTDVIEAQSLVHNLEKVDIYSCSWGPSDDGLTMEAPKTLTAEALVTGTQNGRNGKGAIYVWASGNGGFDDDNCNCDGYANSIFTVSVSSANSKMGFPYYAEECAPTMATTFSSGGDRGELMIISADIRGGCTEEFSGTSASAPLASGIIALVLEANPSLTWRDVQHAIVWAANYQALISNDGWRKNAVGLPYHQRFGFGLMNAYKLTQLVTNPLWKTMPVKSEVTIPVKCSSYYLYAGSKKRCYAYVNQEVKYLEHVQLLVDLDYSKRGALTINIKSPSETRSRVLSERSQDYSKKGIHDWYFMSVHFWGENPNGIWEIDIRDSTYDYQNSGEINFMNLLIHGTKEMPSYWKIVRN